MAVTCSEECQSVHNVVILPDGGAANMQCEPISNRSSLEVLKFIKSINSEPILQNQTKLEADDKVNNYASSILDVDIEKGMTEVTKFNEEHVANLKFDNTLARSLPLQIVGKFMQLLMNHGAELPKFVSRDKFVAERVHDTPTNRSRKYKRSASFNSRRVVLLFSVLLLFKIDHVFKKIGTLTGKLKLRYGQGDKAEGVPTSPTLLALVLQSSIGTIILIYLTLRVRQISDTYEPGIPPTYSN